MRKRDIGTNQKFTLQKDAQRKCALGGMLAYLLGSSGPFVPDSLSGLRTFVPFVPHWRRPVRCAAFGEMKTSRGCLGGNMVEGPSNFGERHFFLIRDFWVLAALHPMT